MWNVSETEHDKSTSSSLVIFSKIIIKSGNALSAMHLRILYFTNGSVFVTKTSGASKPRDYCKQARFIAIFPNSLVGSPTKVWEYWEFRLLADITASDLRVGVMGIGATVFLGLQLRSFRGKKGFQCIPYFWAESLSIDYFKIKLTVLLITQSTLTTKQVRRKKGDFLRL